MPGTGVPSNSRTAAVQDAFVSFSSIPAASSVRNFWVISRLIMLRENFFLHHYFTLEVKFAFVPVSTVR
jgi:hypothetical protein